MSLSVDILARVEQLLTESFGAPVKVSRTEAAGSGWSAQFGEYPWVTRYFLESSDPLTAASVIVKLRRDSGNRTGSELFEQELAALKLLRALGSQVAPRPYSANHATKMLIIEDFGSGPNLEDALTGRDRALAEKQLVEFAVTLGRLHAATIGQAYFFHRLLYGVNQLPSPPYEVTILGNNIWERWLELTEIVGSRAYLPAPSAAVAEEVEQVLNILADPGPFLALSNGDACPANCLVTAHGMRLIDFEHAAYQHALLDVAALRFPFPACGCWSRLPKEVGLKAEAAYRQAVAPACPEILDAASYQPGLAAACAAWTILRAVRIPKLEMSDEPHPLNYSRRGQMLDNINTSVDCVQSSSTFPALAEWLTALEAALRKSWPEVALSQPLYPAFQ